MIGVTDAIADQLLDQIFGTGTAYVAPDPVYVALLTAEPLSTDTGSTIAETDYDGYARVPIAKADLDAADSRVKSTNVDISYPSAATDSTNLVTHVALLDDVTGGNIIMVQELPPIEITTGATPIFPAGSLALTIP